MCNRTVGVMSLDSSNFGFDMRGKCMEVPVFGVVGQQLVYQLDASLRSMRNQARNACTILWRELEVCVLWSPANCNWFFLVSALKYIYWRCLFGSGLRLKPQISILLTSSTCPETPEVECPKFCVFFVSGPSHCSLPFMSTHKWLCWLTLSNFLTVQQFHPHFVQLLQLQHLLIILKCVCFSSICTYSVFLILRTYRIQTTEFLKLSL